MAYLNKILVFRFLTQLWGLQCPTPRASADVALATLASHSRSCIKPSPKKQIRGYTLLEYQEQSKNMFLVWQFSSDKMIGLF